MLDLIFAAFAAYNQIGTLIASAICLALGGLLLGNAIYWQLTAHRIAGTIIGVVPERAMYTAVYQYTLPDGRPMAAKADTATSWLGSYRTGAPVRLLVSAHNPAKARTTIHSVAFCIAGLVCLIPGVLFGWAALTEFPLTGMTVIVGAALAAYAAWRAYGALRRNGRPTLHEWRQGLRLNEPRTVDLSKVTTAEEIQTTAEFRTEWTQQIQQSRLARILIGIAALVLLAIGLWQGARIIRLETEGLRAPGQVVELRQEDSADDDGGYVYYPVVRFQTEVGTTVQFKDATGSNPPSRRVGDRVTVLYFADNPADAIIDSGTWGNGLLPGVLVLIAAGLAWMWFAMRKTSRRDAPLPLGGSASAPSS